MLIYLLFTVHRSSRHPGLRLRSWVLQHRESKGGELAISNQKQIEPEGPTLCAGPSDLYDHSSFATTTSRSWLLSGGRLGLKAPAFRPSSVTEKWGHPLRLDPRLQCNHILWSSTEGVKRFH